MELAQIIIVNHGKTMVTSYLNIVQIDSQDFIISQTDGVHQNIARVFLKFRYILDEIKTCMHNESICKLDHISDCPTLISVVQFSSDGFSKSMTTTRKFGAFLLVLQTIFEPIAVTNYTTIDFNFNLRILKRVSLGFYKFLH